MEAARPTINPLDIIVHRDLFCWEVTNANNFFLPKGTESNEDRIMRLYEADGFSTFEDCKGFILNFLCPAPNIAIYNF